MNKLCGLLGLIVMLQAAFGFGPFDSKPYLTPTSSPTTAIYINWNTESIESTAIAYGLTGSLEDTLIIPGVRNYHHVELTGLIPGTQYFYRVLPAGDQWQFKTFPMQADTFAFAIFGDTRSDSVAHQSVIDRITAYQYEVSMHVGDMVADGNSTSDWRTYFHIEDTLFTNTHFLPAIGNHEAPFWPYDTLFALPGVEDYYSLNYGNTHFIILNTEMDLYGAQQAWLINDLNTVNNDTTIDWIIVSFHRPPYSSGNHGSQIDVRDAWCPILAQHDVDIVFAGHDHDYERTIDIDGVVYIVTGGGGAPLRHVGWSSWTAYSESTYQFCHIEIENRNLALRAIKPDGTVFDSLFISKPVGINEEQSLRDEDQEALLEVNPNPFTDNTRIKFCIGHRAEGTGHPDRIENSSYPVVHDDEACGTGSAEGIELKIYDASGSVVKNFNLLTAYSLVPTVFSWDGKNNAGQDLPSGIYFVKCRTPWFTATEKILRIRN